MGMYAGQFIGLSIGAIGGGVLGYGAGSINYSGLFRGIGSVTAPSAAALANPMADFGNLYASTATRVIGTGSHILVKQGIDPGQVSSPEKTASPSSNTAFYQGLFQNGIPLKQEPYKGLDGWIEYMWTGGNKNGFKYDIDGNVSGHSPIMGDAPSIGSTKGGYTLIKTLGKFSYWESIKRASNLPGQARSVYVQIRNAQATMIKMFKDSFKIDGRFLHR